MADTVTRFQGGVNNQSPNWPLANLAVPFVGTYAQIFDDFLPYAATDWTVTGAGTVAQVANGDGGQIAVTSSAGGEQAMQRTLLAFTPSLTKDFFFSVRGMIDDTGLSGFFIGLSVADTSPYATAPTDGIFWKKTAGAVNAAATLRIGSVDVASAVMPYPLAANVMGDIGFAYSAGEGVLRAFIGPAAVRLMPASGLAQLPAVPMSTNISSYGAAARALTVDYTYIAKGR